MNQDSNAIITLCSHICVGDGVEPLEPKEYSILAEALAAAGKSPKDLFDFSPDEFRAVLGPDTKQTERFKRLLDRNASMTFELSEYQNMGIEVITRADTGYPKMLKRKTGNRCPPLFYYAGDLTLLDKPLVGYVGARTVTQEDVDFTIQSVRKTVGHGYGVVSGGAKGIDTVSGTEALLCGGVSVEYLSDSLLKKLKKRDVIRDVQQGELLLLSAAKPDAPFHVGMAMMRNQYIYAQSVATMVVRSDLNKGGTWTGAAENLKNNLCPTLCWNQPYPGNQALIQKGAIPIDSDWDGDVSRLSAKVPAVKETYEQASLFDMG